ncbi:protein kinase [Stigmatella sp. ncwal1]|uniref:Protein kinase n=1 Tax=Stigmatella ashevillensis TaxID=2995309 RepID=A0ABT5D7U8_9BACT|nr:serine/threonine-protein kinase [Stigmatella ashevillena]MDC0709130.1 protein kinase [Stigmatella ashevillena]
MSADDAPGPEEPVLPGTVSAERPASPQAETPTMPGEAARAPSAPTATSVTAAGTPNAGWERYEFLGLLGSGGMGEVHKARDRRLGRIVALKFIRGSDPNLVMRFLQEARAQARIDHPNVCKVYEVGEVHGKAYIAMQFVEGQRLDRAAASMSQPKKLRVMQEVATAIHEAHRQGVIHRDLKPTNILVERGESGRFFPVVMDFGLAYDTGQGHGLTVTGAVMGTPSYMAPEQARGELSSIDRRSDVYSLGATLYELLAGVAPFTDATVVGTLAKVLHEEPPSLHSHVPAIERDLEIIVLKCLSKEPSQRYPSARALAEDLARFLDGEPIIGRRPSLPYRLRRLARKHRALVGVSALSLTAILALATFGVRTWLQVRWTQQQSEERARLAEQLGQEVKEIEWFLRLAYALPLHDTGREQQLVRERMKRIAERRTGLGASGEGLVSYALGRGSLALREFDKAHEQLLRARQLGIDSPELHYALGRVLGERYYQAMEEAQRSGNKEWVAARQRALEQQYLEPALQSLERSQGVELESPRYLEGLIAFYRRQYDVAARAAGQAVSETPWLHEAWKLAGDVARAQAMEQFDRSYDVASSGLQEAARLYGQAIQQGGSDALSFEALAEVWMGQSDLDEKQGKPQAQALERALAASEKSIQASLRRSGGYTQKAYVLMRRYRMTFSPGQSQDKRAILEEWIATGRRAVELNPQDVSAHDALGIGYLKRGEYQARNGEDPSASWSEGATLLSRALEFQPNHPWALNDLGLLHQTRGKYQAGHGQDPRAAYREAIRCFEQAAQADPKYLYPLANQTSAYGELADYAFSRGLSPEEDVRKALEAAERGLSLDPQYYWTMNEAAAAEQIHASYLIAVGQDPRPALERARQYLDRSSLINPSYAWTHVAQARNFSLEAVQALQEGRDPGAVLAQGRQAVERAIGYAAGCAGCRIERARVELAVAEWEQRRGRSSAASLHQALIEARRAVELYPYVGAHQELANAYWRLAETEAADRALADVDKGLKQVELALRLDPERAHAHAIRGGLLRVRGRRARHTKERRESFVQARAAFARALELNPLLRREYEPVLRDVDARLAQEIR